MPAPSILAVVKHVLSRALRETGQALDRVGVRGVIHANQGRRMGNDDPYIFNDHLSRHRQVMGLLRRGEPIVPGLTVGAGGGTGNDGGTGRIGSGREDGDDDDGLLLGEGERDDRRVRGGGGIAFLAPCATLVGNVHLSPDVSVFYKAILKADVAAHGIGTVRTRDEEETWRSLPVGGHERKRDAGLFDAGSGIGHPTIGGANGGGVYVGEGTNIQDACVVTSYEGHAVIGRHVTVGHAAQIHSATVGDESLVGMGAVLNPGCVVERQSFVAAGAVVGRGQVVVEGELWGGNPARKLRDLSAEERGRLRTQAEKYVHVARSHGHVMELGGNVPDSFVQYYLEGPGAAMNATLSAGLNESMIELLPSSPEINPTREGGLKGQNMNDGIGRKPLHDSYDREEDVTDELRVRVKM
jgi:carbonic anhydrase/acetyltransferase-like protein (isoleucine patch superfamily)